MNANHNMINKFVFALLCWSLTFPCAATILVRDDAGHMLKLQHPATRVISLAPSLTEMLYEAGGGDKLVGAVEYSDFPPEALKVPRIGSNQKLDLERIAGLKPDLVLVWFHGNALREVERLGDLGIPMFYLEPRRIADIPGALERIGQLLGTGQQANAAAERFRKRNEALRSKYARRATVKVFYQIAASPLLTINDQQIISDAIRTCGGANVFGRETMLVPQLSTESVVAANPEIILTARMDGKEQMAVRTSTEDSLKNWLQFTRMSAVQHRQMWLIPGDQISRHGPRILDGTEAICTAIDSARQEKK